MYFGHSFASLVEAAGRKRAPRSSLHFLRTVSHMTWALFVPVIEFAEEPDEAEVRLGPREPLPAFKLGGAGGGSRRGISFQSKDFM